MKILLINNHGGGWADFIEVQTGTTVAQLFEQQMDKARPEDFLIRVNRLPVSQDQVLQDNDRVSITATKIEGAAD